MERRVVLSTGSDHERNAVFQTEKYSSVELDFLQVLKLSEQKSERVEVITIVFYYL